MLSLIGYLSVTFFDKIFLKSYYKLSRYFRLSNPNYKCVALFLFEYLGLYICHKINQYLK